MPKGKIFSVGGGSVQTNEGLYITRGADDELLELCRAGAFVYVLTPRQMGKSSLMVRTAERLAEEDCSPIIIDLQLIGASLSAEQWYYGLIVEIDERTSLTTDVKKWWKEHEDLGYGQRLTLFFKDVLLAETGPDERIVVFVDEIDTTLSLGFTDDFFTAVRSIYMARANEPELRRLSFVLIGVATPTDLISDPKRTPFNIGQRVDLTDFTFEEALPLAAGLGLAEREAREVLGWALSWTGGHPFLTQQLCAAIAAKGKAAWTEGDVDAVVAEKFLGEDFAKNSNLLFVRDMLTKRAPDRESVLNTYAEVLRGERPVADEGQSVSKAHLKLSGVVCAEDGALSVRNRIYREVFNERWIKRHNPTNWTKRLVRAAAVLIAVVLFLSVPVAMFAAYQWRQAKSALGEAVRQSEIAQQERAEAVRQREEAVRQREEADRQRLIAEENGRQADEARRAAEQSAGLEKRAKTEAEVERNKALAAAAEAERERQNAVREKAVADLLRAEAVTQTRVVEQQKKVAEQAQLVSQSLSAQRAGNYQHAALLAREALRRDRFDAFSIDAYQALSQGLSLLPRALMTYEGIYSDVELSADGRHLLSALRGYWPIRTAAAGTMSATGRLRRNKLEVYDAQKQETDSETVPDLSTVAFSPDKKYLLTSDVPSDRLRYSNVNTSFNSNFPFTSNANLSNSNYNYNSNYNSNYNYNANSHANSNANSSGNFNSNAPDNSNLDDGDDANHPSNVNLPANTNYPSNVNFPPNVNFMANGNFNGPPFNGNRILNGNRPAQKRAFVAKVWEWSGGSLEEVTGHLALGMWVDAVALGPGGKLLAVARRPPGAVARARGVAAYRPAGLLPGGARQTQAQAAGLIVELKKVDEPAAAPEILVAPLRLGDTAAVGLAFSEDGQRLVMAQEDGTWVVWAGDGESGYRPLTYGKHDGPIKVVAISPDGSRLATSGHDNSVVVWMLPAQPEVDTQAEFRKSAFADVVFAGTFASLQEAVERTTPFDIITAHTAAVNALAFSPGGEYLATAGDDGTARLWWFSEYAASAEVARMVHEGPVESVSFGANGTRVATASSDGTARVWEMPGAGGSLGEVVFAEASVVGASQNGRFVVLANSTPRSDSSEDSRIWDIAEGKFVYTSGGGGARPRPLDRVMTASTFLSLSDDGRYMLVLSTDVKGGEETPDYKIRLLDLSEERELWARPVSAPAYTTPLFSPDAKYVAFINRWTEPSSYRLSVRDARDGDEVLPPVAQGAEHFNFLGFTPDGDHLILMKAEGKKRTIRVIEVEGGRQTAQWQMGDEEAFYSFAYHAGTRKGGDGYLAGISDAGVVRVWEASSGRVVNKISLPSASYSTNLLFSPDGEHFAVVGSDSPTVWRLGSSERPVATMSIPAQFEGGVPSVNFNADGEFLSTSFYGTTSVWKALTGCEVARFETTGVTLVSGDGSHALVIDEERGGAVWRKLGLNVLLSEVCTHVTRNLTLSEWRNDYRLSAEVPPLKCENLKPVKEPAFVAEQGKSCDLSGGR